MLFGHFWLLIFHYYKYYFVSIVSYSLLGKYLFLLTALINAEEAMMRLWGLGASAGGHPDRRRAGGGASLDFLLGVQAIGVAAFLTAVHCRRLLQKTTLAVVFLGQLVEEKAQ